MTKSKEITLKIVREGSLCGACPFLDNEYGRCYLFGREHLDYEKRTKRRRPGWHTNGPCDIVTSNSQELPPQHPN